MPKRLRYVIETLLVNALIVSSLYQLLVYLANRRFWRQMLPPPVDETPSVSAIVPLRGKTLDTFALLTLLASTRPTADYELLLVLEDEHDPAYETARRVVDNYPAQARIVLSGPVGDHAPKMHNLNAGVQAARGDLIALIDAQVHITEELWNAAVTVLDDPSIGAAYAPPLYMEPERSTGLPIATGGEMLTVMHVNHARTAGVPFAALRNRISALRGGFMVVRRDVLEQAGGLLHLLDHVADGVALGELVRENGYRLAALPVPARLFPEPETSTEGVQHVLRHMIISRTTQLSEYLVWPFTNPLTVGVMLGLITEREGRWWGRRTWWFFVWLRMALAYELDRIRFGRAFHWTAYAQLFMLDTFVAPMLWLRALIQNHFVWRGRRYQVRPGGRATPFE